MDITVHLSLWYDSPSLLNPKKGFSGSYSEDDLMSVQAQVFKLCEHSLTVWDKMLFIDIRSKSYNKILSRGKGRVICVFKTEVMMSPGWGHSVIYPCQQQDASSVSIMCLCLLRGTATSPGGSCGNIHCFLSGGQTGKLLMAGGRSGQMKANKRSMTELILGSSQHLFLLCH